MKPSLLVLFLAACGSVKAAHIPDAGAGADADPSCTSAAECPAGAACDVADHVCVTGALTIDDTGFYDDGTRWWTGTSGPQLHGTIDGPAGATLQAFVASVAVGAPATITGSDWALQLPSGTIADTDTAIVFRMTAPDGGVIERAQTFSLDDKLPVVTMFGQVLDERGDTIDFTTGEPVHTHAGPAIDLGAGGCPAVYKYAYLMDQTDPLFGRQLTANPLAWQIKVQTPKLDDSASAYRVRAADGSVALDWTSFAPDASGVYTVTLLRNAIPALGTTDGVMNLDVRFRDWVGNEAVATACWTHHPLAAPIEITQLAAAGTAEADSVFALSLPAHSPVGSWLDGNAFTIVDQEIVQHTAEPITISAIAAQPTGTFTRIAVDDFVAATVNTTAFSCGTVAAPSTDPNCNTAAVSNTAVPTSGSIASGTWMVFVDDETTGGFDFVQGLALTSMTIPPRTAAEPPHRYRLRIAVGGVSQLWPAQVVTPTFTEYTIGSVTYTGLAPSGSALRCTSMREIFSPLSPTGLSCQARTNYSEIVALDHATLAFAPFSVQVQTAIAPALPFAVPSYVAPATFATPALSWDSGDAGL